MSPISVNIYKYPEQFIDVAKNQLIVFGDGHGNLIKLVHFYLMAKVIRLSVEDFNALLDLYKTLHFLGPNFKKELNVLAKIRALLQKITLEDNPACVVHIGDLLADRGENDSVILWLFSHLRALGYEASSILHSNHDSWHHEYMETGRINGAATLNQPWQGRSLVNFVRTLEQAKAHEAEPHEIEFISELSKEQFKKIYTDVYLSQLRIFHCTQRGDEITIYTHAPVPFSELDLVAKDLDVYFNTETADAFFETCQRIQNAFVEKVAREGLGFTRERTPYYGLLWNRPVKDAVPVASIPYINFKLQFVHGHHMDGSVYSGSLNTDSTVGKITNDAYATGKCLLPVISFDRAVLQYDATCVPLQRPTLLRRAGAYLDVIREYMGDLLSHYSGKVVQLMSPKLGTLDSAPEEDWLPNIDGRLVCHPDPTTSMETPSSPSVTPRKMSPRTPVLFALNGNLNGEETSVDLGVGLAAVIPRASNPLKRALPMSSSTISPTGSPTVSPALKSARKITF